MSRAASNDLEAGTIFADPKRIQIWIHGIALQVGGARTIPSILSRLKGLFHFTRSPDMLMLSKSSPASLRRAWPAKGAPAGATQGNDAADPKLIQLFVPPSDVKGGSEKLSKDSTQAAEESALLEVVN
jgi:hypothetical protein